MVMLQRVVRGLCWPVLGCELSRKSHARLPSSDLEHMLISTGAIPRCVWVFFFVSLVFLVSLMLTQVALESLLPLAPGSQVPGL